MAQTPLSGQAALITGGSSRLGMEIALTLADAGMDVVVHYCSSAAAAQRCSMAVQERGCCAWLVQADISAPGVADQLYARAEAAAGKPLSLLVNNAAIYPQDTLADLTVENLAKSVQINAFAPLQIARAFAAAWQRRAVEGYLPNIVNILDCRVADFAAKHVAYHLAKRMLLDLTLALARELAPGIRVNAVAPGLILPPADEAAMPADRIASFNPLQRCGTPADVAAAVVFLAQNTFITGQVIYVDGGRHLRGPLRSEATMA